MKNAGIGVKFNFRQSAELCADVAARHSTPAIRTGNWRNVDPDIPQHIVQLGNNRPLCFLDDKDRRRSLWRHESLPATGCVLHAYVLMDNHLHPTSPT